MHTSAVRTHLENIAGHLKRMRGHAEQAVARRQAIMDDHTYDTGYRGRLARDEALRELAAEATQQIAREHDAAADVLAWSANEIRAGRQDWMTPSASAQAAADRVRTLLGTLKLPDALAALADDDDQPALEYVHRSLSALARASAGPRANAHTLAAYIDTTYERLTNARWEAMDSSEREYHELRRQVAAAEEDLPRERAHWRKVARGTATADDKFRHGFATDPEWRAFIDGAAEGPVEQVEPVEA